MRVIAADKPRSDTYGKLRIAPERYQIADSLSLFFSSSQKEKLSTAFEKVFLKKEPRTICKANFQKRWTRKLNAEKAANGKHFAKVYAEVSFLRKICRQSIEGERPFYSLICLEVLQNTLLGK